MLPKHSFIRQKNSAQLLTENRGINELLVWYTQVFSQNKYYDFETLRSTWVSFENPPLQFRKHEDFFQTSGSNPSYECFEPYGQRRLWPFLAWLIMRQCTRYLFIFAFFSVQSSETLGNKMP